MIGLILGVLPGLAGKLLDYFSKKADRELQGFQAGTEADTERLKAWLQANADANRVKVAASGWWGAKLIILLAGLPMAAHMAAVALDTLIPPFGSWGIPKLPPPYDGYERDIVLSFFIITPAMPIVSAAALWLGRRR